MPIKIDLQISPAQLDEFMDIIGEFIDEKARDIVNQELGRPSTGISNAHAALWDLIMLHTTVEIP